LYYDIIGHTMTVRDALLQQERELRRQEPYIERTAAIREGNSKTGDETDGNCCPRKFPSRAEPGHT
jgi:hypothetical protein